MPRSARQAPSGACVQTDLEYSSEEESFDFFKQCWSATRQSSRKEDVRIGSSVRRAAAPTSAADDQLSQVKQRWLICEEAELAELERARLWRAAIAAASRRVAAAACNFVRIKLASEALERREADAAVLEAARREKIRLKRTANAEAKSARAVTKLVTTCARAACKAVVSSARSERLERERRLAASRHRGGFSALKAARDDATTVRRKCT